MIPFAKENIFRKQFLYESEGAFDVSEVSDMTIRDIANLANVSVSTVSKVLSGKDGSIGQETKERIQKIAKEYNYVPYGNAIAGRPSQLLGILMGRDTAFTLLTGISAQAQSRGYSTLVRMSDSASEELANLKALLASHVDGILWIKRPSSPAGLGIELEGMAHLVLDEYSSATQENFFSYHDLGFKTAQYFTALGHKKITCLASENGPAQRDFAAGICHQLFEKGIYADIKSVSATADTCGATWLQAHTGIICMDHRSLAATTLLVDRLGMHVPEDLSVVSLCEEAWMLGGRQISKIKKPYEELGRFAADQLIGQIEQESAGGTFLTAASIDSMDSLAPPKCENRKRFVVIGMSNTDTLISVDKQLEPGETVNVKHRMITPGGKGLNQALGVAKLGGSAALISSLGEDLEGRAIIECLTANGVDTTGITMQEGMSSGHAHIYVQENVESSISVYGGANKCLTISDIASHEALFAEAAYCLLQTELDQEIALYTASLAQRHGVKIILKPCAISKINPELLRHVDILVPNQKEAQRLLPECPTLEEQALRFYQEGARTVIITLGENGCYKLDGDGGVYFPPAPISPVDVTGAADAFISALAVYLAKGSSMNKAIKYAVCASALSTTRHGVPPSLVDSDALETFYALHYKNLQERRGLIPPRKQDSV